jgi:glycosyltransferase involved in cell wall biosynthesis
LPRILFICSSWPHGRAFGGQLRALQVARALKQVGRTSILVVGSDAGDSEAMSRTATDFDVLPPILPTLSSKRNVLQKFRWICDPRYMDVHGYVASALDRRHLESTIGEFELVWVLNARTPNILQRWEWRRAHLDIDDVPSTYLRTISQNHRKLKQRWQARVQASFWRRRELLFKQRFTTLSVCSEADKAYMGSGNEVHVIPNGFERPSKVPEHNALRNEPRIGFIGLYSYAPNVDGIRWFLKGCWPLIQQSIPGIRLRLIGKDTDGPLRPADPGVDTLGWVKDPSAEIATWSAMIIPIRFGGGTRIKIAEAFSRKCPAVSTHVGAFGYEVIHRRQLLLSDHPTDFARACIELVQNRDFALEMAERAWIEFLNKWTWDAIAPKVWSAADDCLRRSNNK